MNVSTIELDIAKTVFQVHGEDAEGQLVIEKRLWRKRMAEFFREASPLRCRAIPDGLRRT